MEEAKIHKHPHLHEEGKKKITSVSNLIYDDQIDINENKTIHGYVNTLVWWNRRQYLEERLVKPAAQFSNHQFPNELNSMQLQIVGDSVIFYNFTYLGGENIWLRDYKISRRIQQAKKHQSFVNLKQFFNFWNKIKNFHPTTESFVQLTLESSHRIKAKGKIKSMKTGVSRSFLIQAEFNLFSQEWENFSYKFYYHDKLARKSELRPQLNRTFLAFLNSFLNEDCHRNFIPLSSLIMKPSKIHPGLIERNVEQVNFDQFVKVPCFITFPSSYFIHYTLYMGNNVIYHVSNDNANYQTRRKGTLIKENIMNYILRNGKRLRDLNIHQFKVSPFTNTELIQRTERDQLQEELKYDEKSANSEHYAMEIAFGIFISSQTEEQKARFSFETSKSSHQIQRVDRLN